MDFFSKLTKKAKETYGVASKKTGEIAKEAKLKMKINESKSEINNLYQEIGKKVYEKHTLSDEIDIKVDLEEECTKIDVLTAEIENCLNQIRELKDKKQCPKCFKEIELDAKFCNHCGAKQDVEEHEDEILEDVVKNEILGDNNIQEQQQEENTEIKNDNDSNNQN